MFPNRTWFFELSIIHSIWVAEGCTVSCMGEGNEVPWAAGSTQHWNWKFFEHPTAHQNFSTEGEHGAYVKIHVRKKSSWKEQETHGKTFWERCIEEPQERRYCWGTAVTHGHTWGTLPNLIGGRKIKRAISKEEKKLLGTGLNFLSCHRMNREELPESKCKGKKVIWG